MYVAARGGEEAIAASRRLLDAARRGDPAVPELHNVQLREQLGLLVARVMAEASLYDPDLAALAIRQASGDTIEAAFLLRAYRGTLPRLGYSEALATAQMQVHRRVSAIFKDLPGGQLLGPTFDYTQRLLEFGLMQTAAREDAAAESAGDGTHAVTTAAAPAATAAGTTLHTTLNTTVSTLPNPLSLLAAERLVEAALPSAGDPEPCDITRDPPVYPLARAGWLQMLARADEGWVLGLAYSTQRGYANNHPFVGDIRIGRVTVELVPDELDFAIDIGDIELSECQMINQFVGSASTPPQLTRGYGLAFGHNERKAMAMALVDRALRHAEFDEPASAPAQWQEFALAHGDGVEASGFVQHLKLPHYVTFESEVQLLRQLRADAQHSGEAAV